MSSTSPCSLVLSVSILESGEERDVRSKCFNTPELERRVDEKTNDHIATTLSTPATHSTGIYRIPERAWD